MANKQHLEELQRGVNSWNQWRKANPKVIPDLQKVKLNQANLSGADLSYVNFYSTQLWKANLEGANLTGATLSSVNLNGSNLRFAKLDGANLKYASLVGADLMEASLSGGYIYGASIWNLKGRPRNQFNLIITPPSEPVITVDDIEVAQFIYLILNNEKIREVINTITTKTVLILGRFTPERKEILDALRDKLREHDYLPILFDFDKPSNRDTVETISTLAHMARFVIADLTDAKGVLQELQHIIPNLPSVPIQPLLLESEFESGMLDHFRNFRSFLELYRYASTDELLESIDQVIEPAEQKAKELIK